MVMASKKQNLWRTQEITPVSFLRPNDVRKLSPKFGWCIGEDWVDRSMHYMPTDWLHVHLMPLFHWPTASSQHRTCKVAGETILKMNHNDELLTTHSPIPIPYMITQYTQHGITVYSPVSESDLLLHQPLLSEALWGHVLDGTGTWVPRGVLPGAVLEP